MSALEQRLVAVFGNADARTEPFAHWLLSDVLPDEIAAGVLDLPFAPPRIGDTFGKRETNNATRTFFCEANRARFAVCEDLAAAFQSEAVVGALSALTGKPLAGTSLRIEYCQDTDGFWLEPHTDIGVKRFTMLIYLSKNPQAAHWGTDIYDGERRHAGSAPGEFNRGLIFVPGSDTWHGVEKRSFDGVRHSLIVNYVGPEWRTHSELAYPETPVTAS